MSWTHRIRRHLADRLAPEGPSTPRPASHAPSLPAVGAGLVAPGAGRVVTEDSHSGPEAVASIGRTEAEEATWNAVEARARSFGIVPGTVVDAHGRTIRDTPLPSDPLLGSIAYVGYGFAPRGWATCEGQLLPISSNQALFSLLGTAFGGDGRSTFQLPDLRSRFALGVGTGPGLSPVAWGEEGGEQSTVLTAANLPSHTHLVPVAGEATSQSPAGHAHADHAADIPTYGTSDLVAMGHTHSTGSGTSFENRPPYLGLYVVIALQGLFPSRN
ncbi:MAG: tail fiber protein [Bacteroidota bacterium]